MCIDHNVKRHTKRNVVDSNFSQRARDSDQHNKVMPLTIQISDTSLVKRGDDQVLRATAPGNAWSVNASCSGENREDLQVAIWSHRKNAIDYLRAHLDANTKFSYGSETSQSLLATQASS
jgi:hypothetical protein